MICAHYLSKFIIAALILTSFFCSANVVYITPNNISVYPGQRVNLTLKTDVSVVDGCNFHLEGVPFKKIIDARDKAQGSCSDRTFTLCFTPKYFRPGDTPVFENWVRFMDGETIHARFNVKIISKPVFVSEADCVPVA